MGDSTIWCITTHILSAPPKAGFAYSQAWYGKRSAMLVEIETEGGLTGWGEAFGPLEISASVVKHLSPMLIGRNAMATDGLSAIDIAL